MTIKAILIDSREPTWVQQLKFDGAFKMVTALDYGDAWVTTDDGDMICIERKAPDDLLNSIADERLFCQAKGIRERSAWSYVVVTGIIGATITGLATADKRSTGWQFSSVWGALLTVQEMGVRIVFCENDGDYESTVKRLCGRRRGAEYIIQPTIDSREMSDAERILTSLPGIGLTKAQLLLQEFNGRAGDALAWLTWDKCNVDFHVAGIGVGIKRTVRAAMGIDANTALEIVPDEMLRVTEPVEKEMVTV